LESDAMSGSYSLDQYVHDLRTITARETDPIEPFVVKVAADELARG
jgi:hypothetical protein